MVHMNINISPFLFLGYFLDPHFFVPTGSTFRPEHRREIGVHQVYELYELYHPPTRWNGAFFFLRHPDASPGRRVFRNETHETDTF